VEWPQHLLHSVLRDGAVPRGAPLYK